MHTFVHFDNSRKRLPPQAAEQFPYPSSFENAVEGRRLRGQAGA